MWRLFLYSQFYFWEGVFVELMSFSHFMRFFRVLVFQFDGGWEDQFMYKLVFIAFLWTDVSISFLLILVTHIFENANLLSNLNSNINFMFEWYEFSSCIIKSIFSGRTKWRIVERIKDHNSKNSSAHLLKHGHENGRTHVLGKDFQILGNNYQSNFKPKISGSLFIRQLKPTLNVNEKSVLLDHFNQFIIVIILIWGFIPLVCSNSLLNTVQFFVSCCFCIVFDTEFEKWMDGLLWFYF